MKMLWYPFNPRGLRIPNPNNFESQDMNFVIEPYDLRGTVSMTWTYNDMRESTSFSYLPMLRRIMRMSAASRSDPFWGSDSCIDDSYGFGGKIASMSWKLTGQKTTLVPFGSTKQMREKNLPDGRYTNKQIDSRAGYRVPGWQGAPWCPVETTWCPRPV